MTLRDDGDSTQDPRAFWDAKAVKSGGDASRAACQDDLQSNRLIARVQYRELAIALHWLRGRVSERAAMLDFGCGPGRWVDFFTEHGLTYRGADISPQMLAMARARHPGVEFDLLEGDRLPYSDDAFDLVCSIAVIHHNPYTRQESILSEIARVLRPGGYALLFEGLGEATRTGGITHPRPLESWVEAMRKRGLRLERHEGTRYGVLRVVMLRTLHAVPVEAARHAAWQPASEKPWWQRAVDGLDGTVSPALAPLLPPHTHRRGLLLFRKAPLG